MNKPINNHPMQIRKDLQKEEMVPVWNTETGRCLYVKHTPTLDVEYMWSPDDGRGLNDEGANMILKIRKGEGQFYNTSWNYHPDDRKMLRHLDQSDPRPAYVAEDLLVYAISIDWEDKEHKEHKTCVPEVPAPRDWEREILHAKAHPKPKNIVRVWDVLFYLEDENGQMATDHKGRIQIFDAPDKDLSHIEEYVDVKDLRKHSVDE